MPYKTAVNKSDVAKIRKLMNDHTAEEIAGILKITPDCIKRNIEYLADPEAKEIKRKNRERSLKAARTRKLKQQAQEMAEKAAAAEVDEEMG